jgi:hypothetical protein
MRHEGCWGLSGERTYEVKRDMALILALMMMVTDPQAPPAAPTLAGHWTLDPDASTRLTGSARYPVCANDCVITDRPEEVSVKNDLRATAYTLDGSRKVDQIALPGGARASQTIEARRDGTSIVISITISDFDSGHDGTTTARLDLDHGHLVISGTRPNGLGGSESFKAVYHLNPSDRSSGLLISRH